MKIDHTTKISFKKQFKIKVSSEKDISRAKKLKLQSSEPLKNKE